METNISRYAVKLIRKNIFYGTLLGPDQLAFQYTVGNWMNSDCYERQSYERQNTQVGISGFHFPTLADIEEPHNWFDHYLYDNRHSNTYIIVPYMIEFRGFLDISLATIAAQQIKLIKELPIHTSQELKDYIPKFNKHYRTCYHTNFTTEYVDSNGKNKYLIK